METRQKNSPIEKRQGVWNVVCDGRSFCVEADMVRRSGGVYEFYRLDPALQVAAFPVSETNFVCIVAPSWAVAGPESLRETVEFFCGPGATEELLRLAFRRIESGEDEEVLKRLRMMQRPALVEEMLNAVAKILNAEAALRGPSHDREACFVIDADTADPTCIGERVKVELHKGTDKVFFVHRKDADGLREGGQGE